METGEQSKNSDKPWLFKKGQSGNPSGRPKGSKSLKTFAQEYLRNLDDSEKDEFLDSLPKELIWKMAEGNPEVKATVKDITTENFTDEELEIARQIIAKRLASDSASQEGGGD